MRFYEKEMGYFLMRLALGVNLFIHGVIRLGGNYDKFVNEEVAQFAASPLPEWSSNLFIHAIPCAEAVIGTLLILGLATRSVLVAGSLLMVCLIFGMGTLQKWDVVSSQMIYVLFYSLLLSFAERNYYALDHWLGLKPRV